jgi:hypothetical protein
MENVNRVVVGWDDSDLANSLLNPLDQWYELVTDDSDVANSLSSPPV